MIADGTRRLEALPREESLRLLAACRWAGWSSPTMALPAIRPVNHIVEAAIRIIIRAYLGTAIAAAVDGTGTVVAYEADMIDPDDSPWLERDHHRPGDPAAPTRPRPPGTGCSCSRWVTGPTDEIIAIKADMVDGFRLSATRARR